MKNRKKHRKKKSPVLLILAFLAVIMIITVCVWILKECDQSTSGQRDMDFSDELDGQHVPLFLQHDERWGNNRYGDDIISVNGCGPTCLSMVYCYLSGDASMDPGRMAAWAEKEGFYVSGVGTSWDLMDLGAKELGIEPYTTSLTSDNIIEALTMGHVIICTVGPGDFTTEGHFIVLAEINDNGTIKVNDPNSLERSRKEWNLERIIPQIKQFWIY